MAEVIRYWDTDIIGGTGSGVDLANAYSSMTAWEAAEQTDLVTDTDWHHVYFTASLGGAEDGQTLIRGWTTGAANYILMEALSSDRAKKTSFDTGIYRKTGTDHATGTIYIREEYVRIDGMQVGVNITDVGYGMLMGDIDATGNDIRIYNCRIEALSASGTGGGSAINVLDADADVSIWNSIFRGFVSGTDSGFRCVQITCNTTIIYNCILEGNVQGLRSTSGTITAINNSVFNNTDDFVGTITANYNASDDGDGTNPVSPSGADWANEMANWATGNYTLTAGGNCEDGGINDPGLGLNTTDMDGDTWVNPWSIGVDQIVSAGGNTQNINISDTWRDIDAFKINIGDDWKDVVSIKQNIGDSWKTVF